MLLISSMAAGFATAPIAAAHFNRIAEYGLLANLLAIPLMGTVVMPSAVVAALLAPLGLDAPALWVMGKGTWAILAIAEWVAGMEGAVVAVPAPPGAALPLIALGGLMALVTRLFWLRGIGVAGLVTALVLWIGAERPALLVASDGSMAGLMGTEGRALTKPKGAGFVAKSWLEDDGDLAEQDAAFARQGFQGAKGAVWANLAGTPFSHFTGKGAADRAQAACTKGALVILSEDWSGSRGPCMILDAAKLRETGALAVYADADGMRIVTAREVAGDRLWNRRIRPRRFAARQ
jgi:competence protein ComEC